MDVHRDFVTLLVAQPLYGELVKKLPRARFIPIVYHFFVVNLALFWLLLKLQIDTAMVARAFYVWVAVFSLFAVAVFWSFMADLFTATRASDYLASSVPVVLLGAPRACHRNRAVGSLAPMNLLIVAMILLEVAVFCVWRLERAATVHDGPRAEPERLGGSAFAALPELIRSPYLLGIAVWISLQSYCATMLYFEQIHMVAAHVHGAGAQTRTFAA